MRIKTYFVYILASGIGGTLYIGVTGDLPGRIYTHREDLIDGFTRRYGVHRLVWFEWFEEVNVAIRREKQLKKWNRAWKIRLIEENQSALDRSLPIAVSQGTAARVSGEAGIHRGCGTCDERAAASADAGFPPPRE